MRLSIREPARTRFIGVKLTEAQARELQLLVRVQGTSISDVVRQALEEFAQRAATDPEPAAEDPPEAEQEG